MNRKIDFKRVLDLIPTTENRKNIERLKYLGENKELRVAVLGKYNHGKSSLLNAIVGGNIFKVADKRETVENFEYEHKGIVWIDTPGLDADIAGADDKKAREAAFVKADFLFLVHNTRTGELDKSEKLLYQTLRKDKAAGQIFLVLTQIDQVSVDELKVVESKILDQFPRIKIISVSSKRYQKGVSEEKNKFVELSRMKILFQLIDSLDEISVGIKDAEIKAGYERLKKEAQDFLDKRKSSLGGLKKKQKDNESCVKEMVSELCHP